MAAQLWKASLTRSGCSRRRTRIPRVPWGARAPSPGPAERQCLTLVDQGHRPQNQYRAPSQETVFSDGYPRRPVTFLTTRSPSTCRSLGWLAACVPYVTDLDGFFDGFIDGCFALYLPLFSGCSRVLLWSCSSFSKSLVTGGFLVYWTWWTATSLQLIGYLEGEPADSADAAHFWLMRKSSTEYLDWLTRLVWVCPT